jgi:hypothetical protein
MNELMTIKEIESQFDNEWILVEDPEIDRNNEVVKGKVLFHSKSRDDVYRKALELRPRRSAFLYTGPTPENLWINL